MKAYEGGVSGRSCDETLSLMGRVAIRVLRSAGGISQQTWRCWMEIPGGPSAAAEVQSSVRPCQEQHLFVWKGRWRGPHIAEHKSLSRVKGSDRSMLFCLAGKGTARTYGWKLS